MPLLITQSLLKNNWNQYFCTVRLLKMLPFIIQIWTSSNVYVYVIENRAVHNSGLSNSVVVFSTYNSVDSEVNFCEILTLFMFIYIGDYKRFESILRRKWVKGSRIPGLWVIYACLCQRLRHTIVPSVFSYVYL